MSGVAKNRVRPGGGAWPVHRWGSLLAAASPRGLLGLVVVIIGWWAISLVVPHKPIDFLPSPISVGQMLWVGLRGSPLYGQSLYGDIAESLKEALGGWMAGAAAAIVVGTIIGRVRVARELIYPIVELLRPISNIAWVPLAIVWFGLGYADKVFVVAISVFFVVIMYVILATGRVDDELAKVADAVGLRGVRRTLVLDVMGSTAEIAAGLRVSLMAGWGSVMIAELVVANSGLGVLEIYAQQSYSLTGVMVGMVCFGSIGLALNTLFGAAERRLLPWSVKLRRPIVAN